MKYSFNKQVVLLLKKMSILRLYLKKKVRFWFRLKVIPMKIVRKNSERLRR